MVGVDDNDGVLQDNAGLLVTTAIEFELVRNPIIFELTMN